MEENALWRILDVSRRLARPIDLSTMLAQVIQVAREVLDADRGTVFLYDEASNELHSLVASGESEIRFPADSGIAGRCAQSRKVINVPDCYADLSFNREIDRTTGYRTRCLLAIPLIGHDDALVGVMQVLNKNDGVFDQRDEDLADVLGAQCAVALQRARLIDELIVKKKQQRELELARDIQLALLPSAMPHVPGYDLCGWSLPANETGGDIYDAFAIGDDRVMLLLADATGHGISAALCVTQLRAMLRMASRFHVDLGEMAKHLNNQLTDDLDTELFITAFLGELEPAENRLTYYAPGQGPLLYFRADTATCEWLSATGVPLGVLAGTTAEKHQIELQPGDIFALISDGVYECPNETGEQFEQKRIEDLFKRHHKLSTENLLAEIQSAVREFAGSGPMEDDMTVVLVKRA